MKFYISFGQNHAYATANGPVNKDTLFEIEATSQLKAHDTARALFGKKWSMLYAADELAVALPFFPMGVVAWEGAPPANEKIHEAEESCTRVGCWHYYLEHSRAGACECCDCPSFSDDQDFRSE